MGRKTKGGRCCEDILIDQLRLSREFGRHQIGIRHVGNIEQVTSTFSSHCNQYIMTRTKQISKGETRDAS